MKDKLTKLERSQLMAKVRGHGNKSTELALATLFRQHKITGWRRQVALRFQVSGFKLQVRPDFVFKRARLAVFVDGCFWHGCPRHGTRPKANAAFWRRKIAGNRARDRRVNRALQRAGWRVLRIWEHALRRAARPPTAKDGQREPPWLRRVRQLVT